MVRQELKPSIVITTPDPSQRPYDYAADLRRQLAQAQEKVASTQHDLDLEAWKVDRIERQRDEAQDKLAHYEACVAEFNAGWEAARAGRPDESTPEEEPHDEWHRGWAWFHWTGVDDRLAAQQAIIDRLATACKWATDRLSTVEDEFESLRADNGVTRSTLDESAKDADEQVIYDARAAMKAAEAARKEQGKQ